MDALRRVHERYESMPFAAFAQALEGWQIIDDRGAYIFRNGPLFHVESFNDGRWCSRRVLRETLGDAIARYGYAETTVRTHHEPGHALARRLGFVKIEEANGITRYRLFESPHLKGR